MNKFIVLEEIELKHSDNLYTAIASTNDFVDAGELARAKKIAHDLQLSVKKEKNDNSHTFIVVERCDTSTLKE
tara:strand:+ start:39 stop:257 length:219 start_codon:yes stop_codon:yes gene_type:complete